MQRKRNSNNGVHHVLPCSPIGLPASSSSSISRPVVLPSRHGVIASNFNVSFLAAKPGAAGNVQSEVVLFVSSCLPTNVFSRLSPFGFCFCWDSCFLFGRAVGWTRHHLPRRETKARRTHRRPMSPSLVPLSPHVLSCSSQSSKETSTRGGGRKRPFPNPHPRPGKKGKGNLKCVAGLSLSNSGSGRRSTMHAHCVRCRFTCSQAAAVVDNFAEETDGASRASERACLYIL